MESCNENIQNDDFQSNLKKYSEVKINNKAIHQEYSAIVVIAL